MKDKLILAGMISIYALLFLSAVALAGIPLWLALGWWYGYISFEHTVIILLTIAVYVRITGL